MSDRKGKTRYETIYVDKYGREVGRESSGGGGSSSHREPSSTRREAPEIPRSIEPLRPDQLRRSSTSTTTSSHNASSARHSTKDRARRESESLVARPHLRSDREDRAEPITTRHDGSKQYHDTGGHTSRSRGEGSYDPADSYDGLASSSIRRPSHSSQERPPTREWVRDSSPSQIEDSMNRMTVKDLGNSQYTYENTRGGLPPIDDNEDDRSQAHLPQPSGSDHDFRVGPVRDKGKGIARDLSPSPTPTGTSKHLIKGTSGQTERLDKNYAKRKSDYKTFFRPGRVFSTLWTESYDDTMQSENDQFRSVVTYEVSYKQRVFSKIRRFVVVKKDDRSCTCLPVTTYDGKGYKKRGIILNNHGLIYSSRDPPIYPDGITKRPLKIILSKGAEKLVNPSYLNYGRVYTVETNVKVRDVGELDEPSKKLLRSYYKSVQIESLSDDEDEGPGLVPNPQQRAVEIAGVGSGFSNSMANSGYEGRDAYDRTSGGYSQHIGWNNSGNAPPSMPASHNSYGGQPLYPNQPSTGFSSAVPAFQYADLTQPGYQQQDNRYTQDSSTARGVPQQGYQQPDSRYSHGSNTAGGFAPPHSMNAGYSAPLYPSNTNSHWSQGQAPQPLYSSSATPVVSSGTYPSRDQSYQSPTDTRYMNAAPAPDPYYDSHVPDSRSGRQDQYLSPASPGRQINPEPDEIYLPTGEEVQWEQAQRRARRDSGRDRDRGRGRSYYER
ncbi:hypothetical protein BKA65DRAFT_477219 [Rhexocercosporidium sp. MPI-PUGE-AT-0058]|nr:hypothetical protein BKA65DRAFT_477219 [Rhexocercosporidium sp. MPI-PUGE-AT-0058]